MPAVTTDAAVFGERLRKLREARKGLTQEKLAQLAGLTTSFVSTLERGGKVPSLTTILKLARGLNVDAPELMSDFTREAIRKMKLE
jgi:transcriptional regulator with XRE-family HTH domain